MAKEDLDLDVEAAAPAKKSGKLKWIIIGVVGLLLLVGATVGVLYFAGVIGGGADAESEAAGSTEAASAEHGQDAKDAKNEKGAAVDAHAPQIYQPMEPPLIVNFDGSANVRFMQITLQVATRDPLVIEKVKEHTPAIRNGLLMLYSSQDPTVLSTRQGKEALLKQSLEEVNRVLKEQTGNAGVENVYFTGFVMQ